MVPTVSIIIPYWKGSAPFLDYCLSSIHAQTFHDYEVIMVEDDPHPPETKCPDVTIIENWKGDRHGAAGATNIGIDRARGQYIKVLAPDDAIRPKYLEKAVHVLDNMKKVGLVYTDYDIIGPENEFIQEQKEMDFDLDQFLIRNYVGAPTTMFCKEYWDGVLDGWMIWKFNETMRWWMDYELWLRIAEHPLKFYHIPESLAEYRKHPAQISNRVTDAVHETECLEKVKKRIRDRWW